MAGSAIPGPLSEEVTIVVFSEMGREPRLNSWGDGITDLHVALMIGSESRGADDWQP